MCNMMFNKHKDQVFCDELCYKMFMRVREEVLENYKDTPPPSHFYERFYLSDVDY